MRGRVTGRCSICGENTAEQAGTLNVPITMTATPNNNVFPALIEGATEIRMFTFWSLWIILRHISYIFRHLIDRPLLPSACLAEGDGLPHCVGLLVISHHRNNDRNQACWNVTIIETMRWETQLNEMSCNYSTNINGSHNQQQIITQV